MRYRENNDESAFALEILLLCIGQHHLLKEELTRRCALRAKVRRVKRRRTLSIDHYAEI